jgi:ketosteroid isomerase-like protein
LKRRDFIGLIGGVVTWPVAGDASASRLLMADVGSQSETGRSMEHQSELAAVDRALRSYYDSVAGGDAAAVARCFTAPATFLTPQGGSTPATAAEVESAFTAILSGFKAQGYSHSTWAEAHMKLLGDTTALASLIVVRHRTDGSEIGTFGFTYVMRKIDGVWKVAVLIGHPPRDVLRVD